MMPLPANCHGSAMAPTATSKEAMGLAVVANGSNFVPTPVSLVSEDQRDEAPGIRTAQRQGLEGNRVILHAAVPVTGYLPPKAGPVVIVSPVINVEFRDIAGTVACKVPAFATGYPGFQVVMSGAFGCLATVGGSRPEARQQTGGER